MHENCEALILANYQDVSLTEFGFYPLIQEEPKSKICI